MNRIERFTGKLKQSEAMLSKALQTAKGDTLVKTDETLNHIRGLIQASQDSIKPGSPGLGTVGEASKRASRGEI